MKREELEIKVKKKLVFEESSEYLPDLEARYFATKEEIDKTEHISIKTLDKTFYDACEIPLIEMKNLVAKAEAAGANFISIDYHGDHNEYDVYGYTIERLSQAEIDADIAKKKEVEKKGKEGRIKLLEERLVKLKSEI